MSNAYQQLVRRRRIALRFEKLFLVAIAIITTATLQIVF